MPFKDGGGSGNEGQVGSIRYLCTDTLSSPVHSTSSMTGPSVQPIWSSLVTWHVRKRTEDVRCNTALIFSGYNNCGALLVKQLRGWDICDLGFSAAKSLAPPAHPHFEVWTFTESIPCSGCMLNCMLYNSDRKSMGDRVHRCRWKFWLLGVTSKDSGY